MKRLVNEIRYYLISHDLHIESGLWQWKENSKAQNWNKIEISFKEFSKDLN